MTVGFIGTGNMATAIVRGMIAGAFLPPDEIVVFDPNADKREELAHELGVRAAESNEALVAESDVVVLAVKPQILPLVLAPLAAQIADRRRVVVSIAAGTTLAKLESLLAVEGADGGAAPVVRVMPNVNAMIGAGMAAVCGNAAASNEDVAFVVAMFTAVGQAIELPESQFSTYTAIAGSSPAFAYLFIDSLARAAVAAGMGKDLATQIAAQTVLGSAKMVLESEKSPWDLIDMVCSPGGTTVAGLLALEDRGFLSTVAHGVAATIARDQEMTAGS
ncbi:pyrroline-5-carboxylate reductase [Sanguibacter gelidistatuariae]|uniref:Pyrroline-5-carboxylate reductase n=1 Tax=Sanguibacter gelidistatuariae TaxID=1814289 RepID=A0A1G6NFY7_9MICO|nr:pyrroline-5-carboxylate reductase [Sanguibacter gelidistatuariae]SDC66631.1 pyrroline-5-carboxylate reductase [Sanguibacter gelidistatuariae]